jgi:hypothetical protein
MRKDFFLYKLLPNVLLWASVAFALVTVPLLYVSIYSDASLPKNPLPLSTFRDLRIAGAMVFGVAFLYLVFRFVNYQIPPEKRSGDLDRTVCKIHEEAIGILMTLGTLTMLAFLNDLGLDQKSNPTLKDFFTAITVAIVFWLIAYVWHAITYNGCKKKFHTCADVSIANTQAPKPLPQTDQVPPSQSK